MCRKCVHIWQCCVPGGGVRACYLFETYPLVSCRAISTGISVSRTIFHSMCHCNSHETPSFQHSNDMSAVTFVICYLLFVICLLF